MQVLDALKEARVKEEMVKLRQRHCRLLNRCFSHIVFVTSLGLLHQALTAPGLDTITWASVAVISYFPLAIVGEDSVCVSCRKDTVATSGWMWVATGHSVI